jgi:hypothetical protein
MACNVNAEEHVNPLPVNADFHVTTQGKDSNPGTAEAPFATLARARDAVRAKIAAGLTGDMLVLIHGGVYPQMATLVFGPDDSGTEKHSITYAAAPGESVTLSGGHRITGWKKGTYEIWTAEVPQVKTGHWYFRQLFVNRKRALRARTPKVDAGDPWWTITGSNSSKDKPAPPDVPVVLSVSGRLGAYSNPTDMEFVYTCNNDMGRKRLAGVSVSDQTITLATPNRWNPQVFKFDWYLSIPTPGAQGQVTNHGYLENALELLDQPGEWYLDRKTGVLSYWPRTGEDLSKAEVVAPMAQNTMLAFVGTPERPIRNVHVRGIHCHYLDWSPPAWGYMGLFCCNVAIPREPDPGHRFIDAAVEYSHARACSFRDGGVAHVGAMGICLREGTAHITIEGNEVADLGGGGIGLGGANVAAGYTRAAPLPQPGEYQGYRIANNYVHHCGADYYGAVGIALFLAQDAVIANNLIHDTAYFGMGIAGSQNPEEPFAKNNLVERNHIYNAMKVTIDGAGMYVAMGHYGRGTIIRDNLIHDIIGKGPCGGLYIDTNNTGCHYKNNVVYNVPSGMPFIVSFSEAKNNTWHDNLIQQGATLPSVFVEAMEAYAGLEPEYRQSLLKAEPRDWACHMLNDPAGHVGWAATQFDLGAEGRGVVRVVVRDGNKDDVARVTLCGMDSTASYDLNAYHTASEPGQTPILGQTDPADLAALGIPAQASGQGLRDNGLTVKLGKSPRVLWIIYRKAINN